MKHKATITIVMDADNTDECDITIEMNPPVSSTQDNIAGELAMLMVKGLREDIG